jgi:hypothetical protein
MGRHFDISDCLTWEEDLPRPQWDLISSFISKLDDDEQSAAWADVVDQWLERLAEALGPGYVQYVTRRVILLSPPTIPPPPRLVELAEACRGTLQHLLPGVADFLDRPSLIIVLNDEDSYYRYLSAYYPEGNYGASAGVCIREGYPHIAIRNYRTNSIGRVLAHEMTHASLTHLRMPQWIEEGLAQMFEHDAAGEDTFRLGSKDAAKQKGYWGRHGLDDFWRGDGFYHPGRVQTLNYQLAEVLVRILLEDHKPRWFGFSKGKQRELMSFLREARIDDCGEEAAKAHLGFSLGELARRFLGPGYWDVSV